MGAVPKLSKADMKALHARAVEAADAAFDAAAPTPMIVGEAKSLFSSEIDYSKPTYHVADGVCGFAWVIVRPGTSRFARWLREEGIGRSDSYRHGTSIWGPGTKAGYSQSYTRKVAAAEAYAEVLREAGISAYADGRLD